MNVSTDNIALIVASIALIGTTINAVVTFSTASRSQYLNSVTSQRMSWINQLRENLTEILKVSTSLMYSNEKQIDEIQRRQVADEFARRYTNITLQLNNSSAVDRRIFLLINLLQRSVADKNEEIHEVIREELTEQSAWLLKDEWERVKYEASGLLGKSLNRVRSELRARKRKSYMMESTQWPLINSFLKSLDPRD